MNFLIKNKINNFSLFFSRISISTLNQNLNSTHTVGLLPNGAQSNLDEEILNLENINILFSCLKRLDCNQNYYQLIVNCLPDISLDFIPDGKLLNKVINEFLINQNNNVEYFAIILHKVIYDSSAILATNICRPNSIAYSSFPLRCSIFRYLIEVFKIS